MSFQRIFVTGATGFIGRHLVAALLREGFLVRVFARSAEKSRRLFGNSVEYAVGDLTRPATLAPAMKGCDAVIHLGGLYRFGYAHREALHQVNVEGTRDLLQAAEKQGIARFIHVSTAGVLRSEMALMTEKDFPSQMPRWTPYKASKWQAEQLVLEAARKGFPALIVSPTCPIGAGDEYPTPTGAMIRDYLQGLFRFSSKTGINLIAVEDLAQGIVQSLQRGQSGRRYLLAGENFWLNDFLKLLAEETGIPAPQRCLPWTMIFTIGCASEIISRVWPRWRSPLALETALHARCVQFFDASQTREALNWAPQVSVRQGVYRAIQWFRSREYLSEAAAPPDLRVSFLPCDANAAGK